MKSALDIVDSKSSPRRRRVDAEGDIPVDTIYVGDHNNNIAGGTSRQNTTPTSSITGAAFSVGPASCPVPASSGVGTEGSPCPPSGDKVIIPLRFLR
ncbi:MAG: hypothetical protein GY822_06470 [Deltaproteobacteria bacterium]|nr:hypothetical protein [Deltaproteobacteria bacterium]